MSKKTVSRKRFEEVKKFFNRKSIYRQLKSLALGFVSGKNKDIKLVYNDRGENYTDGKTVVVSLFDFAYDCSFAEIFSILKACVGHEVAHVLYSNFNFIKSFVEETAEFLEAKHNVPQRFGQSLAKHVQNSLEDGRIERIHATRYRGILKHFKFLRTIWWENMELTGDEPEYAVWSSCILTLATTGMWPKGFEPQKYKEVAELVTSLIPHIHNAVYANDALTLNQEATIIFEKSGDFLEKCFENELSDEDLKQLADFLNEMASSQEHQSSEMSNRQMENIKEELDELSEDEMQSPHSSPIVSQAKSSNGQSSKQDKNQEDKNEQSSGGQGQSDDNQSSDGQDQSDDNQSSDGQDQSDDNQSSGGQDQSSGGQGQSDDKQNDNGSTSGSNSKNKDNKAEEDEKEGTDNSKSKEGKSKGDDKDSKENSSDSSKGNKSDSETEHKNGTSNGPSDSEKDAEERAREIEEALEKHQQANKDFLKEAMEGLKEDLKRADALERKIEEEELRQTVGDDVEIDAGKFCELDGYKYSFEQHYFVASQAPVSSEIKRRARMLRQKLEQLLFVEDHSKASRYNSGRLNANKLWRLGIDEADVFYKKENEAKDYVATLLIDVSGSMSSSTKNGTRYSDALFSASIIEEALRDLVPFNIILFTTRGDSVVHYNIKGFKGSKFNHCQSFFNEHPYAFNANNDAVSIAIASEKLSKRSEQEKLLFVISDGQPAHYGLSGGKGIVLTKQSVDEARKKGVKVIGIAIGEESHLEYNEESYRTIYGKSLVLTETEKITSTLAKLLDAALR